MSLDKRNTMRRAFITGGAGFLGQRVVTRLLREGWSVRALVRSERSARGLTDLWQSVGSGELCNVQGDLSDCQAVDSLVEDCEVGFHLASTASGACSVLFRENVFGTRLFLDRVRIASTPRLVHVSSFSVYQTPAYSGQLIDEQHPVEPLPHARDFYAYSKSEQESVVDEFRKSSSTAVITIRPGVIYGPGRDAVTGRLGLRVGQWMMAMNPRRVMPYTHVANCADAIYLAGIAPSIEGQTFNIVDDELPTPQAVLKLRRKYARDLRVVSVPRWGVTVLASLCEWYHRWSRGQIPAVLTRHKANAMWRRASYSNSKAKTALGWRPQVSLPQGLEECFDSQFGTGTQA